MKIYSQKIQSLVICEIKVDRGNRDIAIMYSLNIGILFTLHIELTASEPVVPFPPRVVYLMNSIVIDYLSLMGKFDS
jgi:hypothetical protein